LCRYSQHYKETQLRDEVGEPILAIDSDDEASPKAEVPQGKAASPPPAEDAAPSGGGSRSSDDDEESSESPTQTPSREASASSEDPIISPMEGPMSARPSASPPLLPSPLWRGHVSHVCSPAPIRLIRYTECL
jgi:hypothetical protein